MGSVFVKAITFYPWSQNAPPRCPREGRTFYRPVRYEPPYMVPVQYGNGYDVRGGLSEYLDDSEMPNVWGFDTHREAQAFVDAWLDDQEQAMADAYASDAPRISAHDREDFHADG